MSPLSAEEQELLEVLFVGLSPVEMMKLMRCGEWQERAVGERLIVQGVVPDHLTLLYSGEVRILNNEAEIDRSRDGMFVGEMSFLGEQPATATVETTRPCRCVVWSQEKLRNLVRLNPSLRVTLQSVFTTDLMGKLQQRPR